MNDSRTRPLCGESRVTIQVSSFNRHSALGIRHSAFTLIELLVVIAIISILAALLMPSLSRAKGLGKQALCISNLKQLMLAVNMYADDNDDCFPYSRMESMLPGFNFTRPAGAPAWWFSWLEWIWPYTMKSQGVFFCPSGDKDEVGFAGKGHYGCNAPTVFPYNPNFNDPVGYPPIKRGSIENPARKFAIFDCGVYFCTQAVALNPSNPNGGYIPGAPWNVPNNNDGNASDWPKKRHPAGNCVVFVDGHAEAMNVVKFCNETASWQE